MAAERPPPWPPPPRVTGPPPSDEYSVETMQDEIRALQDGSGSCFAYLQECLRVIKAHCAAVAGDEGDSDLETEAGPPDAASADDTHDETRTENVAPAGRATYVPALRSRRILAVLLERRPPDPFCTSSGTKLPPATTASAWQCVSTDPRRRHYPPFPTPTPTDPHARRLFPTQSLDLAPDPRQSQPSTGHDAGSWDESRPLSADLAPDPVEVTTPVSSFHAWRPILSTELEPDPPAADGWLSRTGTVVTVSLSRPDWLSSTEVLGFRRPPDPREPDPLALDGWTPRKAPDPAEFLQMVSLVLARDVSPGTDVLTFRHPPDPR